MLTFADFKLLDTATNEYPASTYKFVRDQGVYINATEIVSTYLNTAPTDGIYTTNYNFQIEAIPSGITRIMTGQFLIKICSLGPNIMKVQ